MIHPIRRATRTKSTNPTISGQYMARTIYERRSAVTVPRGTVSLPPGRRSAARSAAFRCPLRVQRDLLVGRRERPGHLLLALLAEHEPHLLRRPEAFRPVRPIGRARRRVADRAQQIPVEETRLTTCLRCPCTPTAHSLYQPLVCSKLDAAKVGMKAPHPPRATLDSRNTQEVHNRRFSLLAAGIFERRPETGRNFRSFPRPMRQPHAHPDADQLISLADYERAAVQVLAPRRAWLLRRRRRRRDHDARQRRGLATAGDPPPHARRRRAPGTRA